MKEQLSFAPSGVCRECGCDDENACPGGCIWANQSATLCSRCVQQADPPPLIYIDPEEFE